MNKRAVVRADCVIKVHSDIVDAYRNKSHHRSEPDGGAGGALRYAKPFVKVARSAKGSQGDKFRVDRQLI